MSEVIILMEKVPKNCDDDCWGDLSSECPWSEHIDGYTMEGGRPRNCPIKGVLPETHGKWEERYIEDANPLFRRRFYCSRCGNWTTYGKTLYCPNCGAKMDGEDRQ